MNIETDHTKSYIEQLRDIRDQISLEIQDMTPEDVLEYFNKKEGLFLKSYWNKPSDPKQESK